MKNRCAHLPSAWHGRLAHDRPLAVPFMGRLDTRGIGLRPIIGGTPMPRKIRRGFSLMEVLLAVFILGIGLIMVATIFPIGADWTRQSTEDSVAQTIAQNALAIVQDSYAPSSLNATARGTLSSLGTTLAALPNFTTSIPVSERSYQFGNSNPFPAPNPAACNYYWTALGRLQPGQAATGASRRYDIYILVFRKGAASQTFSGGNVPGVSDNNLEPTLSAVSPYTGVPVGAIGIGQTSGTVFRVAKSINYATNPPTQTTVGRPLPMAGEQAIYGTPADGTNVSPLIYVYQTTISY